MARSMNTHGAMRDFNRQGWPLIQQRADQWQQGTQLVVCRSAPLCPFPPPGCLFSLSLFLPPSPTPSPPHYPQVKLQSSSWPPHPLQPLSPPSRGFKRRRAREQVEPVRATMAFPSTPCSLWSVSLLAALLASVVHSNAAYGKYHQLPPSQPPRPPPPPPWSSSSLRSTLLSISLGEIHSRGGALLLTSLTFLLLSLMMVPLVLLT